MNLLKYRIYRSIYYRIARIVWKFEKRYDEKHGTDFFTGVKIEEEGHNNFNQSSIFSRLLIKKYLKGKITHDDAIIDAGCGKGMMLYFFSKFPFEKVRGLEYSHVLAETARDNLRKIHKKGGGIEIVEGDAATYQDYDEFNYIFLYNPFTELIMKPFLANLKASVKRKPRTIHFIYHNPVCHDLFISEGTKLEEDLSTPFYHLKIHVYTLGPESISDYRDSLKQ